MTATGAKRPIPVLVIAVFLITATGIAETVGTALLVPGTFLDAMWRWNEPAHRAFLSLGRSSGWLLILLGAATAAAARGLLHGRRWAWWLAIGLFAVNGGGDAVALVVNHDVLRSGAGVLVAAGFLGCLLHRSSRAFFQPR